MIYLYALAEPLSEAPSERGVDGAPLRVLTTEKLSAVVSDYTSSSVHVEENMLWGHERVVEAIMTDRPVLPMRFGSVAPDDAAVRHMLARRQKEFSATLRRLTGMVEIGVGAVWQPETTTADQPVEPGMGPGSAYLLRRSGSYRRARSLLERVDRVLAELSKTRVDRLLKSPTLPVSAAYLVPHRNVHTFTDRVAELDAEIEDAQVFCTGPWPPYSFTRAQAS